jgi:hypothetical protein
VLPAGAEGSSVGHGEGGYVPDFAAIASGVCKSACTLFLGIRNVCVERGATLMFRAGHDIAENVTGPDTRASRCALPLQRGPQRHMDSDAFYSLPGNTIIDRFGYRECAPKK